MLSKYLLPISCPAYGTLTKFFLHQVARNKLGLNEKAHEIAKEDAIKEKEKKDRAAQAAKKKKTG